MTIKILIAEDSATHRLLYAMTMERMGCMADIAVNGAEALEFFKKGRYDIVFLDLNMPRMDGIETAHAIQKINKHNIPVYAISGFPSAKMEDQFETCGIRRCLLKPLLRKDFYNVMAECGFESASKTLSYEGASPFMHMPEKIMKSYAHELRSRGKACESFFKTRNKIALARECHTIRALAQMLHMQAFEKHSFTMEDLCQVNDEKELEDELPRFIESCYQAAALIERNLMLISSSGSASGAGLKG